MDFLMSFVPSWMNVNLFIGIGIILLLVALYFTYKWLTGSKSPFSDMGEGCDPQIENACGKDANCHPDETGEKGICFPKEEEAFEVKAQPETSETSETSEPTIENLDDE